jgi:hypothetical protein
MALVDGQRVRVGDWVSFKSDVEQSGQITAVLSEGRLVLTNPNGFQGDYIGGQETTIQRARDCWLEG